MTDLKVIKAQIAAAYGREPFDLVVRNVQLLNVYTGQIVNTDLGIKYGRVTAIASGLSRRGAREVFDAKSLFCIPGLIDAHCHIESTLLTPAALSEAVIPQGTTTLLIDPMEIANVAGYDGLVAFIKEVEKLPYRVFIEVPSRVPTAPGLETTGGVLGVEETRRLLSMPATVSLGELDSSKIQQMSDEHLLKVLAAYQSGKVANGHAIGLEGLDLQAYATAGLSDDHECVTFEELKERLEVGMKVMVREGSSERNLEALISGVVEHGLDTRNLMFCTDDKHTSDIVREGHINYNVNRAIELGLAPLAAIQMATLNPAQHFHIEHLVGSVTPGRCADFILSPSLQKIEPIYVFVGGQLVAQETRLLVDPPTIDYPDILKRTVQLYRDLSQDDFKVSAEGEIARVRVIKLIPDQIVNVAGEATLRVVEGVVQPDVDQDVLLLACVERYGKNGNVGLGFVQGFGLKRGAIGCSVAHDHHNLMIVGVDPMDMLVCVRALVESQGGFVVVSDGEVRALMPLPLCGLMSDERMTAVNSKLLEVRRAARLLGCELETPFMALSFVSLPTVPELGITDMGLIDVRKHRLVELILD